MKQLLILSGKGGTGKTTIASAFIKLANPIACGDCDVDAPNLHLVTSQKKDPKKTDFYGLPKSVIDNSRCNECDLCRQNCRFDAISFIEFNCKEKKYIVDEFACEGCGVCEYICPTKAIDMKPAVAGELMLYKNEESVFSTAKLKMGSGNSGLLVTEVKNGMKDAADEIDVKDRHKTEDFAVIDGSPGIGCPVIASLSGVDMVLIVAEPSISGIKDMERIIKTADGFSVKTAVCINKYDTNLKNTEEIKKYCATKDIGFVGTIPYDKLAVKAINSGLSIVEIDCPAGKSVKEVYEETVNLLLN